MKISLKDFPRIGFEKLSSHLFSIFIQKALKLIGLFPFLQKFLQNIA